MWVLSEVRRYPKGMKMALGREVSRSCDGGACCWASDEDKQWSCSAGVRDMRQRREKLVGCTLGRITTDVREKPRREEGQEAKETRHGKPVQTTWYTLPKDS